MFVQMRKFDFITFTLSGKEIFNPPLFRLNSETQHGSFFSIDNYGFDKLKEFIIVRNFHQF